MPLPESVLCLFKFRCDKAWKELDEVANQPSVRYCTGCCRAVFLCRTYEEVAHHTAMEHCIAFGEPRHADDELLGEIITLPEESEGDNHEQIKQFLLRANEGGPKQP